MLLAQLYKIRDLLRTAVEHIVCQIARTVSTQCSTPRKDGGGDAAAANSRPLRLLVTGGGFHNSFLLSRLGEALNEAIPRGVVIDHGCDEDTVDFKEAVVFAFLGLRCVLGLVNVDSAVTGSTVDTISGAIHLGVDRAAHRALFYDDMRANLRKSSNALAQRDSSTLLSPSHHNQRHRTQSMLPAVVCSHCRALANIEENTH